MARSRRIRKRENRPRRRTSKRGKKTLRAKTTKRAARRTRVKARRPRRHARVTRRRVHRKRGGKGVALNAAKYNNAHDGKSIAHKKPIVDIAHKKPIVDISLPGLHGRTPGATGSPTSGGPKNVKPGSVATAGAFETALNDIFNSSGQNPYKAGAEGAGAGAAALALYTFYQKLSRASASRQAALLKAFGQRETYSSDVTVQPRQYITKVTKADGTTVYKIFTNKEAALNAAGDAKNLENITASVKTVPEKITLNLKAAGWDGPQGAESTLKFIKNPRTGMLESTDPVQLAKTIRGMESIDTMTSTLDPKYLESRTFKSSLRFLKGVAEGNVKAGASTDLLDLLQRSGLSQDEVEALRGAFASINDATQKAVAESDSLEDAEKNLFQPVKASPLEDALEGAEED